MYYVYRFLDVNENIIYIGKTADIKTRMYKHFGGRGHLPNDCYEKTKKIDFLELKDAIDGMLLEKYFIMKYHPEFNSTYQDSEISYSIGDESFRWKEYKISKYATISLNLHQIYSYVKRGWKMVGLNKM